MSIIADLFAQAVQHHQNGNLAQAEALYRQVLQTDSSHADAFHLLGILAHQAGNYQLACTLIGQAIALNPRVAVFHNHLGMVYKDMGQLPEAINCFRQAVSIDPNYAEGHNNLGGVLKAQGRIAEAIPCFRQALLLNPNHAAGHVHLGNLLKEQGKRQEAIDCYRQALAIDPNHADAHHNLGFVLKENGQPAEAIACYRQALRLNPAHVDAHNNLGIALISQGKEAEALACFQEALRLDPNYVDAHYNLGLARQDQGQLAQACACYRQALRINPNHVGSQINLGIALAGQGKLAEAADCYEQALRIHPGHGAARWNRGLLRLLQGNFEGGGWADYEQRWPHAGMAPRILPQPRWDSSPQPGKTILVHAEQGFGDTIQFLRYLPMVKERVGTVIFECPRTLLGLLKDFPGVDHLVRAGAPLPAFDVHVPLLSLPGLLGTTLASIPAAIPYLVADPKLVEHWRQVLFSGEPTATAGGAGSPLNIGIAWQGNPQYRGDKARSIPLKYFEILAGVPGVRLVSLQKGEAGTKQLSSWEGRIPILDLSERLETFSDTAAVMMNLDLIISSCTSIPHLAGALGRPVWTVLQFVPDWRWQLERLDSPWYPTMRLFRQARLGDWQGVFERIAGEIQKL